MTIFNGKIHYKWPFSIAMLNYQRVTEEIVLTGLSGSIIILIRPINQLVRLASYGKYLGVHYEKSGITNN
jgi:hypothetical protein